LGLINDKHQEIKDHGGSIDAVVGPQARAFYVNTARFIQDNNLMAGDGEDDGEGDGDGEEDEGEDAQIQVQKWRKMQTRKNTLQMRIK
jgi:hypothetical protein